LEQSAAEMIGPVLPAGGGGGGVAASLPPLPLPLLPAGAVVVAAGAVSAADGSAALFAFAADVSVVLAGLALVSSLAVFGFVDFPAGDDCVSIASSGGFGGGVLPPHAADANERSERIPTRPRFTRFIPDMLPRLLPSRAGYRAIEKAPHSMQASQSFGAFAFTAQAYSLRVISASHCCSTCA
jgi:hypothetical protein